MKLKSMHIAGFGKFYDTDFSFDDGLNCIAEDNGYGKTTLAAFIRVMFYGMDGYRSDTKSFTDRQHYYPFGMAGNSPVYGGNIVFEYKGAEYRIERFFGEKREKDDRMTVYRNSVQTDELGVCPGKTIFRVDAQSFDRTLFFRSDDTLSGTTDDINVAMNRFLENTCGGVTAAEAAKKLMDAAYEYRGKRASSGKISALEAKRADLKMTLRNFQATESSLDFKYESRERIKAEREALSQEKRRSDAYATLKANVQRYEEKLALAKNAGEKAVQTAEKYPLGFPSPEECAEIAEAGRTAAAEKVRFETAAFPEEKEKKLADLDAAYPAGFPDDGDITLLRNGIKRVSELDKELENAAFPESDRERMRELAPLFIDHLPDDAEYEKASSAAQALQTNEKDIAALEASNPSGSAEYAALSERFARLPSEQEVQKLRSTESEYREKDKKLSEMIASVSSGEKTKNVLAWIPAALMGVSVLLLAVGVVMLILDSPLRVPFMIAGGAVLVLAVLLFAVFAAMAGKKRKTRDLELLTLSSEKKRLAGEIRDFLAQYSYSGQDDIALCSVFYADVERYRRILADTEATVSRLAALRGDVKIRRDALLDFIGQHGIPTGMLTSSGIAAAVDQAKRIAAEYCALVRKNEELGRQRVSLGKEKSAVCAQINEIFGRYLINPGASPADCFDNTVRDREAHRVLAQDKERCAAIRKEALAAFNAAKSKIAGTVSRYGLNLPAEGSETEFAVRVNSDREACAALREENAKGLDEAEKFRLANCPDGLPESEPAPSEELEAKIKDCDKRISILDLDIESCEADVQKITEYAGRISDIEEEIKDLQKRHDLLVRASGLMTSADNAITERYIAPVRDKFNGYSSKLGALGGIKLDMDENFVIKFDANSALREDKYLSEGQKTVCSFALRLALTDNIYKEEKPFLVFDDPFSSLDRDAMELCAGLVRELSDEFQIIYFCCHDSRVIY